jgi:hypothetical protein
MIKENGIDVANVQEQGFGETQAAGGNNAADRKVIVVYNKPAVVQKAPLILKFTEAIATAKKGDKVRLPNLTFTIIRMWCCRSRSRCFGNF